ncbi:MAG TPA: glutamate--tRNA ligase [Candidatus Omnitrophota bacterium]|nr:glutamate--tRNA ligase [Candidatus Omnitrophota bacterium]
MKVRFAPSPTGYLHIGGARTALFNWMYARSQKGMFVLRIEDTDLERSKKEYLDEIVDSMKWLGLSWDEFYLQSERFDIYRQHAQKLLDEGKAYKDGEAVILKIPAREIKLYDLIRGEIVFDSETIKDQVLMKSDGSPTYSFACVVDDALMEITHVIRGEDHISNTPKQMMIYEALGFKAPKFAHLPLIMDAEGGRMSKRTGAVAVTEYRNLGFVADGIVNYLMLLGWSPGPNQEIVSLEKAVQNFSIKKVNKAAAVFSMDKLLWVNSQHIKNMSLDRLTDSLIPLLRQKNFIGESFDRPALEKVVALFKGRLSTLNDFIDWADFVFLEQLVIRQEDKQKYLSQNRKKEFETLAQEFEKLTEFTPQSAESAFRDVVARLSISSSDLVHPVRVALTGKSVGPGLFETMSLLGKERTIKRLQETFS